VQVFHSFLSGGGFTGWVRASEVRPAPARLPERPLTVALESEPERVPMCVREPIRGYNGPASIARGTEVRSRPDGTVWARVPEQTRLVVEDVEGDWVAVVGVEGLRGRAWCPLLIERAWVPRASVRMPSTTAETLLPAPEQRAEAQARPFEPEPPTIDLPLEID
jgi:hypothetical protein